MAAAFRLALGFAPTSLLRWCGGAGGLCAFGLLATAVWADTTLWATDSSGNFNAPANWTAGVPDANDDALFIRGGGITYTVTFPGRPIIQGLAQYESSVLNFGSNNVTFVQSSAPNLGPSTYTMASSIVVGAPSGAAMLTTSLALLSAPRATLGLIGSNSPTTMNVNGGTFRVSGSDPAIDELIVGNDGGAALNVASGAQVQLTGGNGNIVVGANTGVNGSIHLTGGQVNISGGEGSVELGAVAGASGTIELCNAAAAWNQLGDSDDAPLVIGALGNGTLNVMAGQVNNYLGIVGDLSGSVGTATVAGPGSRWMNRSELRVSNVGAGSLTISNAGLVTAGMASLGSGNGGDGTVDVTGTGSRFTQTVDLRVGVFLGTVIGGGGDRFGVGHLNIRLGGRTDTMGDATIGSLGSQATVTNANSLWSIGGVLSLERSGVLEITAGGKVVANTSYVGRGLGGSANINGAGSTYEVLNALYVGQNGTGTVTVTGGGRLKTRIGFVGVRPPLFGDSNGIVEIDGAGSAWTGAEQVFIGYQSQGSLSARNGGQVTSGTSYIGFTGEGSANVSGAGSVWTNSESMYLGVLSAGNLVVADGGKVVVDDLLSIGPQGRLQGNSLVDAEVRNGGTVAPGVTPSFGRDDFLGTLQIDGTYTQTAAGKLEIDLNSGTSFDKLSIFGEAHLGGLLDVTLTNNFSPMLGSQFEILRANDGVFNSFAAAALPALDAGLMWSVIYSNFAVQLQVVQAIPGDFNLNGAVENADLTLLLNNWAMPVPPTPTGWLGIPLTAPGSGQQRIDGAAK